MPSPGYRVSGKEVEVRGSGFWHHQLCGCCNLQLIQSHSAPSHGPPARVLPPLFFPAKSLLLPKPHDKKQHSKTTWSSLLSFRTVGSFSPFQNCVVLFLSPQNLVVLSFFTSEPHGPLPFPSEPRGSLSLWLLRLGFKSQRPSSFAAPFPTPPTVSYTCQHPRILPPLLGCHSKSGQVWPHGMEPIISKLSSRPCNQGELLPSPMLGGIWSHPPGSKHGHSYLTHP